MKISTFVIAGVMAGCALALSAVAENRAQHYEAKPSETLDQAVKNFSEYNGLLSEVLKKDKLSPADLERIHELTYTLEVALAKINEDMAALPATLERLHIASEQQNEAEARGVGEAYLEVATTVVR